MKILLGFAFLIIAYSFVIQSSDVVVQETQNINVSQINWPFTEGVGAPYFFKPQTVTLASTPAKGINNVINVTGLWRTNCTTQFVKWTLQRNKTQIDYLTIKNNATHQAAQTQSFTWDLDLPQSLPSGSYLVNLNISRNGAIYQNLSITFKL